MEKRILCVILGEAANVLAELWDMLHGLGLAWKEGYRKVILESDSLTGINLVKKELRRVHIAILSTGYGNGWAKNGSVA